MQWAGTREGSLQAESEMAHLVTPRGREQKGDFRGCGGRCRSKCAESALRDHRALRDPGRPVPAASSTVRLCA